MKNTILILTILIFSHNLFAQSLNRSSLIKEFGLKENSNVLLNGELFGVTDSLRLNTNLKNLNRKLIVGITSVKNEGQIGCQNSDVIIIEYAVELPRKIIRNKFDELIGLFKDEYFGFSQHILNDSKDPVLYINNQKIHHTEVKQALEKLDKNKIVYINIKTKPQSTKYHGQNATNGVVVIWTEKELKEASN